VLQLKAHGDLYSDKRDSPAGGPVGTGQETPLMVQNGRAEVPLATAQTGWKWPGYIPQPECSSATSGGGLCAVRRVGAAVRSAVQFSRGAVMHFRMKPCTAWGTSTSAWLFNSSNLRCHRQTEYMGLWKAAVHQSKVSGCDSFLHAADQLDGKYHDYILHWHTGTTDGGDDGTADTSLAYGDVGGYDPPIRHYHHFDYRYHKNVSSPKKFHSQAPSGGLSRATLYLDGQVVRRVSGIEVSALVTANGDLSPLVVGLWFPNAWAGAPEFATCDSRLASVKVTKLETAQERWCQFWPEEVSCSHDAHCTDWVKDNCLSSSALPAAHCQVWLAEPVCSFGSRASAPFFNPRGSPVTFNFPHPRDIYTGGVPASALTHNFSTPNLARFPGGATTTISNFTHEKEFVVSSNGSNGVPTGVQVQIFSNSDGARIFYTLDGTRPLGACVAGACRNHTPSSKLYDPTLDGKASSVAGALILSEKEVKQHGAKTHGMVGALVTVRSVGVREDTSDSIVSSTVFNITML